MPPVPIRHAPIRHVTEHVLQYVLFTSRWLLAPIYLGLIGGLVVLLIKFAQSIYALAAHIMTADGDNTIVGVLGLVDIALMASLVLMVMFSGYENFISDLDTVDAREKPGWMGHVNFGDIKIKLMASIVAISGIHLLENFMKMEHLSDRVLAWSVGIHMAFVFSGFVLAIMDRIRGKDPV